MISHSKSILAKLLATENIRIEHRKVQTAYFDLKSRTLICPIWKDMSPELYDLLMGHEVSHALHTPEEGWHDQVKDCSKGFKTYLNVVEDARIEKKIKQKYPGLKPSFSKAYQELVNKQFFGPDYIIESEHLPLIDRINLHYKIGSYANITFESNEKKYLERIDKLETWDDVVNIAKELFEYGKTEKKILEDLLSSKYDNLDSSDYDYDDYDDYEESNSDGEQNREAEFDSSESGEDEEMQSLSELLEKIGASSGAQTEEDLNSVTDNFFREKESSFLDDKCCPYLYADIPNVRLENIVVPYKKLLGTFNFYTCTHDQYRSMTDENKDILQPMFEERAVEESDQIYKKFMDSNKKYVSYLIKEFELKRNAKQFARAMVSKSGELDVKKAFSYKFNDDIFKRVTTVPNGKSHGLLMFVDFSGSMHTNMKATIEQTLLLALFCKKVGIPFRVLAFSDNSFGYQKWFNVDIVNSKSLDPRNETYKKFSCKPNEFLLDDPFFYLAEYLSSEMNSSDFTRMSRDLLYFGHSCTRNNPYYYNDEEKIHFNKIHELNGTPLEATIISSIEITKQFKKNYKLDIVNTIFLTDGDGPANKAVSQGIEQKTAYDYEKCDTVVVDSLKVSYLMYLDQSNLVLTDRSTMIQGLKRPGEKSISALLQILTASTGANVVGFYLMNKPSARQISAYSSDNGGGSINDEDYTKVQKILREHKYAALNIPGYKKFFILPAGKDLEIEEDEMSVSDNANKNELRKAFIKLQKSKLTNRVFLNKFIEQID